MEIQGKIIIHLPTETGVSKNSGKTWVRKRFVLGTEQGNYNKEIAFSAFGDKIEIPKEGIIVKVFFDLESREYNNRRYTEAQAWKVDTLQGGTIPPQTPVPQQTNSALGDEMPF